MVDDYLTMSISTSREQLLSFFLVGIIGNLVGWIFYYLVYESLTIDIYKPTISWIISFHFGVLLQHFLHRRFTFEDSINPYFQSLLRTYLSYIGLLIFGIIVNFSLNEILNIYHHFAWLLTLAVSIPVSFVLLKYFAFHEKIPNHANS